MMTVAELASKLLVYEYDELSFGTAVPKARIDVVVLTEALAEARLEALEEAAVKVETMKFAHGDSWHCFMAPSHEAEELAAAIRALKAAQHGEKELRKAK